MLRGVWASRKSAELNAALPRHVHCLSLEANGESAMAGKPTMVEENGVWVVRVEDDRGKVQEYRCATERQARQLTMALAAKQATAP